MSYWEEADGCRSGRGRWRCKGESQPFGIWAGREWKRSTGTGMKAEVGARLTLPGSHPGPSSAQCRRQPALAPVNSAAPLT